MPMMRICSAFLLALTLSLGLAACEEKKGPAERLGEKLDNAAGEVKSEAEDVKKEVEKAAE